MQAIVRLSVGDCHSWAYEGLTSAKSKISVVPVSVLYIVSFSIFYVFHRHEGRYINVLFMEHGRSNYFPRFIQQTPKPWMFRALLEPDDA